MTDAELRALLARNEAEERAAAASGQASSSGAQSSAPQLTPEEEARMRAAYEEAERERKEEQDEWIANAAQRREAKQAKKGKGRAPASLEPPSAPRPRLPTPPRVDLDREVEMAFRNARIPNRRRGQ